MLVSGRLLWGRKMASPYAAAPLVRRLARPVVAGDHRGQAAERGGGVHQGDGVERQRDRLAQPPENRDRIVVKHGHQHEQRSAVARVDLGVNRRKAKKVMYFNSIWRTPSPPESPKKPGFAIYPYILPTPVPTSIRVRRVIASPLYVVSLILGSASAATISHARTPTRRRSKKAPGAETWCTYPAA
jgi:hypothetical protein